MRLPLQPRSVSVRTHERSARARPFLKWAGGKGQLLEQYQRYFALLPRTTYHEPFLGGGAVYFHLRPARAVLSDLNRELIVCYQVVRDSPGQLIAELRQHLNDRRYFYETRALDPERLDPVRRASRTIYLNKTCFNGLYRVNSRGRFNVPFGRYNRPLICDEQNIRAASRWLKDATLEVAPFESVLERATRGDFIYLDPPYQPLSSTASFTAYTPGAFREEDQVRLAEVVRELDRRKCRVMLSNSNSPLVRRLYKGLRQIRVAATRSINSVASRRGRISELLILNYAVPGPRPYSPFQTNS